MYRSIGSILHALSSSDQLEHINQAKRAFIRYVFHGEVASLKRLCVLLVLCSHSRSVVCLFRVLPLCRPLLLAAAEVRVPFNAIVLASEQLQLHAASLVGEQACDIREMVALITEQSTVVARILNDVLSMQKIEDGGFTLTPECFDLSALVSATLASFREALAAKHLTLVTVLPPLEQAPFVGLSLIHI